MTNFLTASQLMQAAPSIFAEKPAAHVSDKYAFVPTTQVIKTLSEVGWFPVKAQENRVRLDDKQGYQKHLVRLRHESDQKPTKTGSVPEIILTNSHDGLASFNMSLGLFRFVCLNGLVVSDGTFESARIKHVGYRDEDVIDIVARVVQSAPLLLDSVNNFEQVKLTAGEQMAFAKGAMDLRWEEGEAPVEAKDLLQPRRWDDKQEANVWTTFNVVQENMIKGGLRGRSGSGRRTRTREVASVTQDVRLNKALWTMAQALANHKTSR